VTSGSAEPTVYRPRLPADEIERIRRWHEQAYHDALSEAGRTRTFGYLGMTVTVPPDVMPVTSASHVLGEAVVTEILASDSVLDMGTGSGINAILAARNGARVVAVDVDQQALDATRANAARNGVASSIDVRESNLFAAVTDETFDVIVFDPPYRWFRPRDALEAAITDENYAAMTRFFREARRHLAPGGRILVGFATSGDIGYLRHLIDEARLETEVVGHLEVERDGQRVEYFAFRLT
jgi:release factor glutamine methyltransferase